MQPAIPSEFGRKPGASWTTSYGKQQPERSRILKKKYGMIIMAFLMGGLTACTSPFSDETTREELVIKTEPVEPGWGRETPKEQKESEGEEPAKGDQEETQNEIPKEPEEEPKEEPAGEERTPERKAYVSVLEKVYQEQSFPNGRELGFDGISDISDNWFAICDIDKDGREELILLWTTTITAGMAGIVYDFDSASGSVREELLEFPSLTFYDNGVVEAGLSHNHGMAGDMDFWPYTFYQYDQNTDTYVMTAQVDAWNKAFYEKDYDGNPFPDELDTDGDGVLYKVTIEGKEDLLDLDGYKQWRDSFVAGAEKMEIPFLELTEEHIYR